MNLYQQIYRLGATFFAAGLVEVVVVAAGTTGTVEEEVTIASVVVGLTRGATPELVDVGPDQPLKYQIIEGLQSDRFLASH